MLKNQKMKINFKKKKQQINHKKMKKNKINLHIYLKKNKKSKYIIKRI